MQITIFLSCLIIGMSKFESILACYALCLMYNAANQLLGIIVYRFMCRLDRSVNYILNDILTSSLRFTSMIRKFTLEQAFICAHLIEITVCICMFLLYIALHTVHIVCLM